MLNIPESLRKNVKDEWGKEGETWLKELPSILQKCEEFWSIKIEPSPFELSYNYVAPVTQKDGNQAIIKVGFSDTLLSEMNTLKSLAGHCMPRLLEYNEHLDAMLIEKIHPGTVLKSVQKEDDEKATRIAADLIKNFPVAVPSDYNFPTVAEWVEVFEEVKKMKHNPMPLEVLEKAASLFTKLDQSTPKKMLLHGDLHHDNILFDKKRGWLCIDPKGVIGDPMFNAARFLHNPNPTIQKIGNLEKAIEKRVVILSSALETSTERLLGWAYVDCTLSACWFIESGGTTCNFSLRCLEVFDSLMKK